MMIFIKFILKTLKKWAKSLRPLDRFVFFACSFVFALSGLTLLFTIFFLSGTYAPRIGGSYSEGVIGTPHFINPLLAPLNEVDRELVKLIFPSLLTYTAQGELVGSLAKDFKASDNGKVYEFTLREGVFWEDGKPLTAEDVAFTVKAIQDEKTSSPLNRIWSGVKVEVVNPLKIRFSLAHPYAFFLQNATLGILPSHIWASISPSDFTKSEYNLKPVGAGPYHLERISQLNGTMVSAIFTPNPTFFGQKPYIDQITFEFYPDSKQLTDAYERGQVQSIPITTFSLYNELKSQSHSNVYTFLMPRYFALFLNEKANPALANKDVREALTRAIQKQKIIADVLKGQAQEATSPITPALKKYYTKEPPLYTYDSVKSQELLKKAGFPAGKPFNLELTIIDNDSLTEVANQVINDWQAVGIVTSIKHLGLENLRDEILQKRNYQVFLFGQSLALEPDPFSLWHSSQQQYPGVNLSSYKNPKLDSLLEELRQTIDSTKQQELFSQFETIMTQELPAIFLYSPYQLFAMRDDLHGVTQGVLSLPEDRFNQISDWYINERRVK